MATQNWYLIESQWSKLIFLIQIQFALILTSSLTMKLNISLDFWIFRFFGHYPKTRYNSKIKQSTLVILTILH